MKIKFKLFLSLGTILIISGVIFNILLRGILIDRMESTLKESMMQIMNSTSESVKYRVLSNPSETNEEKLISESNYLMKYISLNTKCNIQIRGNDNEILSDNTTKNFSKDIDSINSKSQKNAVAMSIKYSNSSVYGILSYPIFVDNEKLGTLTIESQYKDIYESNRDTINILTIIEISIFVLIFFTAFIIIYNILKPIERLTSAVKEVKDGNYNIEVKTKGKDEVAILSKEFIEMKDTIAKHIETIKEEKEKVERLEKHRKEFFDNVTHELKTPITGIIGYSEMLLENLIDDIEFKNRALKRINAESERINRLVLDLIAVSKGKNEIKEEMKEIAMGKLISEIMEDMSIKASKYSLNLCGDIADAIILGRENKLREVIINVIDNAIKYSKNSNIIEVNSYTEDNIYIIKVKNHSDIIEENVFKSIFDPFVKTNASLDKYSSGLGLYICKEIIEDHNGIIDIENGEIITVTIKLNVYGGNYNEKAI